MLYLLLKKGKTENARFIIFVIERGRGLYQKLLLRKQFFQCGIYGFRPDLIALFIWMYAILEHITLYREAVLIGNFLTEIHECDIFLVVQT